MSSHPDLKLDWCNYRAAKYAVERWHYSRKMPVGKLVKIGVWERGEYVGAVIFGLGGGGACNGKQYGLARNFEMAELQRIALREHQTPVSRIIAQIVPEWRGTICLGCGKPVPPGIDFCEDCGAKYGAE